MLALSVMLMKLVIFQGWSLDHYNEAEVPWIWGHAPRASYKLDWAHLGWGPQDLSCSLSGTQSVNLESFAETVSVFASGV